jgi:ketosteroid isomerase-like protein
VSARGETIIRKAYAAFSARDLAALIELSDEAVEVSTVTGLLAGRTEPYRGYDGLRRYIEDLASTWKRLELQPQTFQEIGDDQVLVFGRVRAWHERGFLDSQNAWLWTIRDEKVVAVRVYADPNDAQAAFGDVGPDQPAD